MEFNTKMPSDMQHAYGRLKAADLSAILLKGNSSFQFHLILIRLRFDIWIIVG